MSSINGVISKFSTVAVLFSFSVLLYLQFSGMTCCAAPLAQAMNSGDGEDTGSSGLQLQSSQCINGDNSSHCAIDQYEFRLQILCLVESFERSNESLKNELFRDIVLNTALVPPCEYFNEANNGTKPMINNCSSSEEIRQFCNRSTNHSIVYEKFPERVTVYISSTNGSTPRSVEGITFRNGCNSSQLVLPLPSLSCISNYMRSNFKPVAGSTHHMSNMQNLTAGMLFNIKANIKENGINPCEEENSSYYNVNLHDYRMLNWYEAITSESGKTNFDLDC